MGRTFGLSLLRPAEEGGEEARLPLLLPPDPQRPIALRRGKRVLLAEFQQHAGAIVRRLPVGTAMINLCEDRYYFLAAYAAALSAGHNVLLPPSRAEQIIREVTDANPGSYLWDDAEVEAALSLLRDEGQAELARAASMNTQIPAGRTVMTGFTSGSTGQPKKYPKAWDSVHGSTARNAHAIRQVLQVSDATPWILATVPPQHMYGMELSILLPLIGGMAVHSGRPLFPADIARALEELPPPRVLVSTPVHLRAMVESNQQFPPTALIVSATAPLDRALAESVERKLHGQLLEMFGSTETCVFACRRTAVEAAWQMYEGVTLQPRPDGTLIDTPWFSEPILLQDIVELHGAAKFVVRGRNTDMVEVAGKRASLADLTRRLAAIAGVSDAVVFQPEQASVAAVRRLAALVVAPGLTARQVLDELARSVDAVFLPRPLLVVDSLPRNELGKLPRELLLQALHRLDSHP